MSELGELNRAEHARRNHAAAELAARVAKLTLRRDELQCAIDNAPCWGAAVGARYEELRGVEAELRRIT